MKHILHVLQHFLLILGTLILLILSFNSEINYKCADKNIIYSLDGSYSGKNFTETDIFNQMFGISIADILAFYSGNQENMPHTNIYRETVSGNILDDPFEKRDLSTYEELYARKDTNLKYFIVNKDNKSFNYFGNLDTDAVDVNKFKNEILDVCSLYLYYFPKEGIFDTNTQISEYTVAKLLSLYYEFLGDDVQIMVGLRKNLVVSNDSFLPALLKFNLYTRNYELKIAVMILSFFLWGVLFLILGLVEAKSKKAYALDYIPIEIRLCILAASFGTIVGLWENGSNIADNLLVIYSRNVLGALVILCLCILCVSLLVSFFVYGLIRRISCGIIAKSSLIYKLWIKICGNERGIYNNLGPFVRALLPALSVVLINVGIGFASAYSKMYPLLIIPFVVDCIHIYICYISKREHIEILEVIKKIASGDIEAKADVKKMHSERIAMASSVNKIGEAVEIAVNRSLKDEKMKADLITNVSHDLRTPLTSIINYVDLLKKERIDNDKAIKYIQILDEKTQRLKSLTDDLIEASKISSGNIIITPERVELKELLIQAIGEFSDRFEEKSLNPVLNGPDMGVYINVDPGCMFRIIENLFNNICKYALERTRIFIDISASDQKAVLIIKNISANPINVNPEDLTERFTRGDESRNTEGSGLGLSIAKSLSQAMGGKFEISVDGDLFKVGLTFPTMM